jgi:pimeloyl-ACP methyl ester carboxylesterase
MISLLSLFSSAQNNAYDALQEKSQTKIIYDRVFGLANATVLKQKEVNSNYFLQVYHELQRADFLARLPKLEALREAAKLGVVRQEIPLGVLITDFENIRAGAIDNGDVFMNAHQQYQIKNGVENIFEQHAVNLISPLVSKSKTNDVTFILKEELLFNTTTRVIQSIAYQINENDQWTPIQQNQPFTIHFNASGKQTVNCRIQFRNGEATYQSFVIQIESAVDLSARNNQNAFSPNAITTVTATIPYQGFGETTSYLGQGEYEIFPDTVDGILDKPVFLVDGFDPGDSRNIAALYASLNYGTGQNLANYLRTLGFDIVLVNFPNYTRPSSTTVVDGGVDFIQRNAFVLVEVINQINAQKVGTQKNVIIGPSMGGLISRYALRYMETNNLNHDTRLYISFDSPHQGANVPIGFQHLFNYMAYGPLGNTSVQPLVDGLIKSPAARQMLIDHMEGHLQTGSAFEFNTATASLLPTGAPNFRNAFQNELNAMGFPTTTRNVSIANGAGNGTMNYSPNFEVMNHTFNVTPTQRAIINLRFTPAANQTNQVSRFRGQQYVFIAWVTGFESLANSRAPIDTDGLDSAPGGRFDMTGFQADLGTDPLLTEFFDNLNADYFTFIPTWSAMAISGTNNLYTPVTGTSTTPFVASSIPTVNENHVTLNSNNVTFALNEIINGALATNDQDLASIWIKNPVEKTIEINSSYQIENATVTITDMLGKTIYTANHQNINGTLEIQVSLTKGIYLITLNTESGRITKKIVKE